MPVQALIFVPLSDPHARHWVSVCFSHCLRNGYTPLAVVRTWDDVWRMIRGGVQAVVVVGRRDHLDATRTPRLEVITEQLGKPPARRQRRPRRTGSAAA